LRRDSDPVSLSGSDEAIISADYGSGCNLAMLIFGEINVFCPQDAKRIISCMRKALNEGGQLLLEPPHPGLAAAGGTSWSHLGHVARRAVL